MTREQKVQGFAWGLTALVAALAFVAWGDYLGWKFSSSYQLFPLFGLLAFSLMWAHYIASVTRQYYKLPKAVLSQYFEITSMVVLGLILLHPGLLTWQLWRDDLGLPPGSGLQYVEPAARWAILFGFFSLGMFLLYEFRRFYQERTWWKYVEVLTDVAIVLIYFHSLRLGSTLMSGWFQMVWYFYGLSLFVALVYIYAQKTKQQIRDSDPKL